jgi:hypothetical protein
VFEARPRFTCLQALQCYVADVENAPESGTANHLVPEQALYLQQTGCRVWGGAGIATPFGFPAADISRAYPSVKLGFLMCEGTVQTRQTRRTRQMLGTAMAPPERPRSEIGERE